MDGSWEWGLKCDLVGRSEKNLKYLIWMFQSLVEQCTVEDPDTEINMGCLLFKVGQFLE